MTSAAQPMVIKPRIRGYVCITAHPDGCAEQLRQQIARVRRDAPGPNAPKRVLIVGASTGYGLSSRIVAAFRYRASTLGVFFERPASNGKTASAGWYNSAALEEQATAEGLWARSLNGDAFTDEIKEETIELIRSAWGSVDLLIYSLAAPRRMDPRTGMIYRSTLKPIGEAFVSKNLDTDRGEVHEVRIDPAGDEEVDSTVRVMGGEDWSLWVRALQNAQLLAPGFTTVAYDYLGPRLTWPIYHEGTIGRAKEHLRDTAASLDKSLGQQGGRALISVNKAVVTQASSAIPVVPLYLSILFKVMKAKGLHEDTLAQMQRLFDERLYTDGSPKDFVDDEGRLRLDDWEMRPDVQEAVEAIWPEITTESIEELTDFDDYKRAFRQLFGFDIEGVDYEQPVDPVRVIPSLRDQML